ncbi:hypothetical protein N7931_13075 [Catenovulum sp. 2E275]|uniref:c-type cytochrome domain-containing protein n=1 Tax=Catenovulum sp. 2E275 TaxID=2980497 RepID=UPI0021D2BB6A|nr:c-type cytochrome domain-containing protein [Catenovulum sp. 2E275]MCU4676563.1 hypothetical protein [Catenovulum sp. 2E275]
MQLKANRLIHQQGLGTAQYFTYVAIITCLLLVFLGLNDPVNRHQLLTGLGLKPQIKLADDSFYKQRVEPIFNQYCAACHGIDKSKGGLRTDSFIHTLYSGKSTNNIVPFEPASSQIINRMKLPQDDKRLMPPLGWDKPSEDELKILTMWINKGASAELTAADFPDAPQKIVEVQIPLLDKKAVQQARLPVNQVLSELAPSFPHAFNFIARDSHLLRFSNVSFTGEFTDQTMQQIAPAAPFISSLYLRSSQLTDSSFNTLLAMHNLTEAYLQGAQISPDNLSLLITKLTRLKTLSIEQTLISEPLKQLCQQHNIQLKGVNHG